MTLCSSSVIDFGILSPSFFLSLSHTHTHARAHSARTHATHHTHVSEGLLRPLLADNVDGCVQTCVRVSQPCAASGARLCNTLAPWPNRKNRWGVRSLTPSPHMLPVDLLIGPGGAKSTPNTVASRPHWIVYVH
jgi:hypothetical protein